MYLSGETEENHETLSQDSRSTRRDLNRGPPEYEVGVLTTRPRSSLDVICQPQHRI
jgi:hypothetical protein